MLVSPNEQQPAYIPPSLTGQGVQAYMPSNTNPAPGIYVPPPPDIPAWQQAQHAPLQGGSKKFKYTKPTVDPNLYAQGHQSTHPIHAPPLPPRQYGQPAMPPQQSLGQPAQHQYPPEGQMTQQIPALPSQYSTQPPQQAPFGQPVQSHQPSYGQPVQLHGQFTPQSSQQPTYEQTPYNEQYSHPQNQWQPTTGPSHGVNEQNYPTSHRAQQPDQQQQWQQGHQVQHSLPGAQYPYVSDQDIQAPKPLGRSDTTSSDLYTQPSPQSQPVSPIGHRQSTSFTPGHQSGFGHTGSVSSIALANLHAQRTENKPSSPIAAIKELPTPPPPRDDKAKFSALGSGGPSDWERFGVEEEIDDEELFDVKKEGKEHEARHSDSVELPAHVPSPPSTHGWPSPATQTAPLSMGGRRSIYAPTPPPATASPAQQHTSHPPQQVLVTEHATNASAEVLPTQQRLQQALPSSQQGFVMEDGDWTVQSANAYTKQPSPVQQQLQTPSVVTHLATHDASWGTSQLTPTQGSNATNDDQFAELKAKDEVFEHLRAHSEIEKAQLQSEIDKLNAELAKFRVDFDDATKHAVSEKSTWVEKVQTMEAAAEQVQINVKALSKEKDLTLERMREDMEGKEHNIEERDKTIAELRSQLEQEKAKELPRPTPADVVPDIDPWYVSSLERYIKMLRTEASQPQIEDKIKTFRAFLKSESQVRGIKYYDAPLPAPVTEPVASDQTEGSAHARRTSNNSTRKQDLNVHVPKVLPMEDDYDYSPGGRPILKRKATLSSTENSLPQQHISPSVQSTTILTPASSVDDDTNKTPVQSPPEEKPQPQYKAYVPPAGPATGTPPLTHRRTMSFSNSSAVVSPPGTDKGHDEIFFGAHGEITSTSTSRPLSSDSTTQNVPVPAPLSFTPNRPTSAALTPTRNPNKALANLLLKSIVTDTPCARVKDLRARFAGLESNVQNIDELTKTWEKAASLARRKKDDARRQRQEANEEHNDDLFNNDEISYAEMNQLEGKFKQKEAELKAQEDREEYKSYVETVFDPVYDGLQADIKALNDIYIEVEDGLLTPVSGTNSFVGGDVFNTKDYLDLLHDLHEQMEQKHEKVVQAVAERDRRYKKTETQPLYAAGNISKMKSVEKHFENAEKQAMLQAKREKAERVGEFVNLAEEVVINAVGAEQKEMDATIAAIKDIENGKGETEVLDRAHHTVTALKSSSIAILRLFNSLEMELNISVLDADIAQAKAEGADAVRIQELEDEKSAGAKKMTAEYERRVTVLNQDEEEIRQLLRNKGGKKEMSEEQEKEERLRMALEEAKRRNGQA
jgi:hypothetical protein